MTPQRIRAPRQASAPLRIVAIGGGTGLSTLLKGLKRYVPTFASGRRQLTPAVQITAVVTVTDDGGSSGRLRREFDILPPGDIRNCMVALSEDETLLAKLFQHRFSAGRGLKGHSFGNLFLAALTQITGDFPKAVRLSSEVLAIAGDIFPSTAADVTLKAHLANGQTVRGESLISRCESPIELIEMEPPGVKPMAETLAAIREADVITYGPGSLYTSVAPNLLVAGIPQAIQRSPALKVCLVNLMSQPGETTGMSAADHVAAVLKHAGRSVVDCAVVNTAPVSRAMLARYARTQAVPVANDVKRIEALGVKVVGLPLLAPGAQVRHDSDRLARAVVVLAQSGRRRRLLAQAKSRR